MRQYEISDEHPNENLHGKIVVTKKDLGNCQGNVRVEVQLSDGTTHRTFRKFLVSTTH